jgi:hypothetical protein
MRISRLIEEREKLIQQIADEYKLLQDKIDKIGAFRFTIKGWSLTLVVATVLAGTSSKTLPIQLVLFLLFAFVVVFFFVEKKQTDLSRSYVQRVLQIESVISNALRKTANGTRLRELDRLLYAPGVAHYLRDQVMRSQGGGPLNRFWRRFLQTTIGRKANEYFKADLWFYVAQTIAIGCVAMFLRQPAAIEGEAGSQVQVIQNMSSLGDQSSKPSNNSRNGDKDGKETKQKNRAPGQGGPAKAPAGDNP